MIAMSSSLRSAAIGSYNALRIVMAYKFAEYSSLTERIMEGFNAPTCPLIVEQLVSVEDLGFGI